MKRKTTVALFAAVFLMGLMPTAHGGHVRAMAAPAVISNITVAAPWDSSVTFTFTNVYELCEVDGGKIAGVIGNLDSTLLISKTVSARYGGAAQDTTIAGGAVHKMIDLFRTGGATVFEQGKDGYLRLGVTNSPDAMFGDTQRTFGSIRDYATAGPPPQPPAAQIPAVPAEPQIPSLNLARPTAATVLVNGRNVSFDAYNINGNNFFKLRDLAHSLSGSAKQFEVSWVGEANLILLTSGRGYTAVGGEMSAKGLGNKYASPTSSVIMLDGKGVTFTAFNIENNNYFKLRDIGETFDFGVDWDNDNKIITVDTSKRYTPEGAAPEAESPSPWDAESGTEGETGSAQNSPESPGSVKAADEYLKNFPTVPYPFNSLGLDPQRVTTVESSASLVVYSVDRRGIPGLNIEEYMDSLDLMLELAGFSSEDTERLPETIFDEYIKLGADGSYGTHFNFVRKGDVQVLSALNGGGSEGVDIYLAYKIY
ncbi:MAG: hypothetical protein FWG42_11630 [Clostridiales bacterium]|nr:hypothetical protein [Clostridiales bacterium]